MSDRFLGLTLAHGRTRFVRKSFLKRISAALFSILFGTASFAQEPLSAIEWLNQTATATVSPPESVILNAPPVASAVTIPQVQVTTLDRQRADAVGLLPSHSTGLPVSLWSNSNAADLQRRFLNLSPEPLPAIQALYYTLLLAEADPPVDLTTDAEFLLTRLLALRQFGAVEPALALVEAAGLVPGNLFGHWFDLSLLTGQEDRPCAALERRPHLSSDLSARIFCSARTGDWEKAALIYDSAVALDAIDATDQTLLALFLDPDLIDTVPPPDIPKTISPLEFRLFEAMGTPLQTHNLPKSFAHADLRGTAGWKAELEAAERLARTGALPASQLFGLYTARKPAASGGIWDRVAAIQALDAALSQGDLPAVAKGLPVAWAAMRSRRLEVPFADVFGPRLMGLELPNEVTELAFRILLLSSSYGAAAKEQQSDERTRRYLADLARGQPKLDDAQSSLEEAIVRGFMATEPPSAQKTLLDNGRLGEAILGAAAQLDQPSESGRDDISGAIATLRAVGLEETARRAALQLLLLDIRR